MSRNADIDRELPYMMFDFLIDAAQEGNITQDEAVFLYRKWGFVAVEAAQGTLDVQTVMTPLRTQTQLRTASKTLTDVLL